MITHTVLEDRCCITKHIYVFLWLPAWKDKQYLFHAVFISSAESLPGCCPSNLSHPDIPARKVSVTWCSQTLRVHDCIGAKDRKIYTTYQHIPPLKQQNRKIREYLFVQRLIFAWLKQDLYSGTKTPQGKNQPALCKHANIDIKSYYF